MRHSQRRRGARICEAEGEHVFETDTPYRSCTRCGTWILVSPDIRPQPEPKLKPYTQCEWCSSFIDLDSVDKIFSDIDEGSWYCSSRCLDAEDQMWAELTDEFDF